MKNYQQEQSSIAKLVIKKVNKYFETDCRVKSRKINIVKPRMYACKIIKELTDMPYQDIGDLFGLRHDTIMHAVKTVDNDLDIMPKYKSYYVEIRAIIESTSTYKRSRIYKKNIVSDIRRDIYNALIDKSAKELQQILKTIT